MLVRVALDQREQCSIFETETKCEITWVDSAESRGASVGPSSTDLNPRPNGPQSNVFIRVKKFNELKSLMDPANVPVEVLAKRWFFGNIAERLFTSQPLLEALLETALTVLFRNGPSQALASRIEEGPPVPFAAKDANGLPEEELPFEDDSLADEDKRAEVQSTVFEEFAKVLVLDALSDICGRPEGPSEKGSEKGRKQKGGVKRQGGLLALEDAEAQLFLKMFRRI